MATGTEHIDTPAGAGLPQPPAGDNAGSAQPLPLKSFYIFIEFIVLYLILCSLPFLAGYLWSDKVVSWNHTIIVAVAMIALYFVSIAIFIGVLRQRAKYRRPVVPEKIGTAMRWIVPLTYGLICFSIIFSGMVYLWASPQTREEVRASIGNALPPIGRGVVATALLAVWVLSHAFISYRYAGGKFSNLFDVQRLPKENYLRRLAERRRQVTGQWLLVSLGVYLLPILIIATAYFWAEQLFSQDIINFFSDHQRYAIVFSLVAAYFFGGIVRNLQKHYRMFALHFYCAMSLFILLMVVISFSGHPVRMKTFLTIIANNGPWALVAVVAILVLGPQIRPLLRRVQKAELPGGMKFELGELDKVQQSVSPWRKTVTRFEDLIQLVADLIEETPDNEVVRFLAYTPALGFLTLTESQWGRLHQLLIKKRNIQITCLNYEELVRWHGKFEGKKTQRRERRIDRGLVDLANGVSLEIMDAKRRQNDPRVSLVEIAWKKLPGYYLFANSKRAIIATPLFLPDNLEKDPEKDAASVINNNDRDYENTPVTILGFESIDNWTVWLVNKVCDRYLEQAQARAKGQQRFNVVTD